MRAVVIANGKLDADGPGRPEFVRQADDVVICADGGVRNALNLGLTPDVIVGDFDSAVGEDVREAEAMGAELIRFPAHKDETDSELALRHALASGATEIVFLGVLGGRVDHALANLFLLAAPEFAGVRIRIVDGATSIELCRDRCEIEGEPGDIVSLLPLTAQAVGVVTQGLEYPLKGETLQFGPARGVSNVMLSELASVSIAHGLLAVVHTAVETGANQNG
jgi:thiamine pyrophosphokinase